MTNGGNNDFIAALDVGTTTIRCQIIDSKGECSGAASTNVKLIYPQPGYVEINPDELWASVVEVISQAIHNAGLEPTKIKCLGISTQRATFINWRKDTGKPFHNFITWKDLRADSLLKIWNNGLAVRTFKSLCYGIYLFTRSRRYLAVSGMKLTNNHVSIRLIWVLKNILEIQQELKNKNVMFGTVETWLIYKLTGGRHHITDISNAGGTGLYDPFAQVWSPWILNLLKIPAQILPTVVNNDFDFGSTDTDIFGTPIPIKAVVSDQSASMFGSCCFQPNDIKVTLGTGSFIDLNTGENPHGSIKGIYPVFGWKTSTELAVLAEASCNDTGTLIQWALAAGLTTNPAETSDLAYECGSNDGVYFVPAFSGLGAPICDDKAASGFFGLKPTSTRNHMVRAILESIVYRIVLAFNTLKEETNVKCTKINVDGGVSKNDFICQLLADLTGLEVERPSNAEMSVLGAAYLAGLASGIWRNKEDLEKMRKIEKVFEPTRDQSLREFQHKELLQWLNVVERFKLWYT